MNYEFFISHKHTDDEGRITQDFQIALELYNKLTALGYSVFFSSDTLEKIGSSRYKLDIDAALDTVQVMIVVLTQPEYASSHWVQYEWDSYYNDFLSGVREKANLYTLTLDLDVHSLPRTLRNVQNFPYVSGLQHICECVKNVIPKAEKGMMSIVNKEKGY